MGSFKQIAFFFARVFISAIFLIAAFSHIADFDGMEHALTNALYSISEHSSGVLWLQKAVEEITPLVPLLSIVGVVLLVVGGGFVLLGIKYRLGASMLILFLAPTTLIMHHFFLLEGPQGELQSTMFWKNIAILGGLILLILHPKTSRYSDEDL